MSHATASSSTGSYSIRSLPNTPPGITAFSDDVTYSGPFTPSPFKLLFLVNTGGHDDALRNVSVGQPHLHGIGTRPTDSTGAHDGSLSPDVCDSDPNSPEFLRAVTTYNARIQAAVELARDQHDFCPRHTRTEPVLPRLTNPSTVVPKLEPPSSPTPVKSEPNADSPSELLYPSDSSSRDSSPLYAQSIGVASASPSPTPESQPQSAPTSTPTDPFNPSLPPHYLSWQTDSSTPPSSVLETSSTLTQGYRSLHGCTQTPGVTGPPPDTAPPTGAPPTMAPPASVWDDETVSETAEQAEQRATVEEVHEFLCALCAEWRTTAPATVRATIARSADYLHLGIYLGIVVSDEGHIDFLKRTIPGAHSLLTTISMGVTTTMTSMETENSDTEQTTEVTDPDELIPMFVGIPDHGLQEVTLPDGRIVHVVRMGSAT
uniref:Uncharacterized protein n=1 Tax=Moniliophthora roreri TaxID=221103 RepID=A0A0W0FG42_MONRR